MDVGAWSGWVRTVGGATPLEVAEAEEVGWEFGREVGRVHGERKRV